MVGLHRGLDPREKFHTIEPMTLHTPAHVCTRACVCLCVYNLFTDCRTYWNLFSKLFASDEKLNSTLAS